MSRKFSRQSPTYQMFEALFLELPESAYPHIIPGLTRGKAINLAQGLNGCQKHWAKVQGLPEDMLKYSAKAKASPSSGGTSGGTADDWILEISISPKHTHTRGGSLWLGELLQHIRDTAPAKDPLPVVHSAIEEPEEEYFTTWLKEPEMGYPNFTTDVKAGNISDERGTLPGFDNRPSGIPDRPVVKPIKYTKEDLIALGWTFDTSGNAIPPRAGVRG